MFQMPGALSFRPRALFWVLSSGFARHCGWTLGRARSPCAPAANASGPAPESPPGPFRQQPSATALCRELEVRIKVRVEADKGKWDLEKEQMTWQFNHEKEQLQWQHKQALQQDARAHQREVEQLRARLTELEAKSEMVCVRGPVGPCAPPPPCPPPQPPAPSPRRRHGAVTSSAFRCRWRTARTKRQKQSQRAKGLDRLRTTDGQHSVIRNAPGPGVHSPHQMGW